MSPRTTGWMVVAAVPCVSAADLLAQKPEPIRDNSLLIEEAYNQEAGVVQHISFFLRERETGNWIYTFTQEWPLWGQRSQFSYTIPVVHLSEGPSGSATDLGDVLLNYRFQAIGGSGSGPALAPRLSLILPTGSWRDGSGSGALGFQAMLPASFTAGERWAFHLNLGGFVLPRARHAAGARGTSSGVVVGGSVIFSVTPMVNFLVESVSARASEVGDDGSRRTNSGTLMDLGIRWAHNLGGLQVVPAVAWAHGFGDDRESGGFLLYLSFEHRFRGESR